MHRGIYSTTLNFCTKLAKLSENKVLVTFNGDEQGDMNASFINIDNDYNLTLGTLYKNILKGNVGNPIMSEIIKLSKTQIVVFYKARDTYSQTKNYITVFNINEGAITVGTPLIIDIGPTYHYTYTNTDNNIVRLSDTKVLFVFEKDKNIYYRIYEINGTLITVRRRCSNIAK